MVPKNHGSSKMVVKFHGSHNLRFWQICASESLNLLYSYLLLVQLYLFNIIIPRVCVGYEMIDSQ